MKNRLTVRSFRDTSRGLVALPSDFMCNELQLGLGERSLVRLLTKALVSLWVEPRLCDAVLSIMHPEAGKSKFYQVFQFKDSSTFKKRCNFCDYHALEYSASVQ